MTELQFTFFLNVILLSRLSLGFKNEPVSKLKLFGTILVQIILLLLFELTLKLLLLMITVIILDFLFYWLEHRHNNLNLIRCISFVIYFLMFGIFSFIFIPHNYNSSFYNFIVASAGSSYISAGLLKINWLKFNLVIFGIMLLINEANFAIRYFFEQFHLAPQLHNTCEDNNIDKKEYNTGRIIGMIERILIFFFVLADQYAAIGFIIAAKGFTRFKELDNRDFAEYVLIGTLLSSLSAITIALLIKSML